MKRKAGGRCGVTGALAFHECVLCRSAGPISEEVNKHCNIVQSSNIGKRQGEHGMRDAILHREGGQVEFANTMSCGCRQLQPSTDGDKRRASSVQPKVGPDDTDAAEQLRRQAPNSWQLVADKHGHTRVHSACTDHEACAAHDRARTCSRQDAGVAGPAHKAPHCATEPSSSSVGDTSKAAA